MTDPVNLSLESSESGITGSFVPATVRISAPASVLSVSVAASVAPGSYELTVKGTGGTQSKRTNIQLTVEAMEDDNGVITPPSSTGFTISLRVNGTLSQSQRETFVAAAQRWSRIITASSGRQEDATISENTCEAGFPGFRGTITNVLIDLRVTEIDGEEGILGRAGWCQIHDGSKLPAYGIMEFDAADVAQLETDKQFDLVILHEMGHVLGFGTLWNVGGRDLTEGLGDEFFCGINPRFTGANAVREWKALGGTEETVPLESEGDFGTCESHWRESLFRNELMTGFLNQGSSNPLSRLTIASMEDLGYSVDYSQADDYSIPPTLRGQSAGSRLELRMLRPQPEGVLGR
jgi:hypothetical protein